MSNVISLTIFTPVLGSILLMLFPKKRDNGIKIAAFIFSIFTFVISLFLLFRFNSSLSSYQLVEFHKWVSFEKFNINYYVGIDGISLFLVLLTTFITPIAILGSWSIKKNLREYMIFMLLLESGIIGVFVSLDLVLFYFFWEIMLVPMYFLIGVWGGENRIYAAVKFFIYTMVGSLLMLVGIIYLFYIHGVQTGFFTFSLPDILSALLSGRMVLPFDVELFLFIAFALAFAIKVPIFPFHTWLPDAHVEAPTAGSVILAGVLLKMGTYGFLRFCLPLFPKASIKMAPILMTLAVIGIIYGALVAMVQPDLKKLVAYSSVSHLGYVVLGIFAFNLYGFEGATIQMVNHGISTGALFLLVGMIYDRRHTRLISEFGGLAHKMPIYSTFFMIITLSSIGLPGLNGFVGEILVLQGTFFANKTFAILAATGMILSAVYMLWMYQRVHFGKLENPANEKLNDLVPREILMLAFMVIFVVWIGVYSSSFLRPMDASLKKVVNIVQRAKSSGDNLYQKKILTENSVRVKN